MCLCEPVVLQIFRSARGRPPRNRGCSGSPSSGRRRGPPVPPFARQEAATSSSHTSGLTRKPSSFSRAGPVIGERRHSLSPQGRDVLTASMAARTWLGVERPRLNRRAVRRPGARGGGAQCARPAGDVMVTSNSGRPRPTRSRDVKGEHRDVAGQVVLAVGRHARCPARRPAAASSASSPACDPPIPGRAATSPRSTRHPRRLMVPY